MGKIIVIPAHYSWRHRSHGHGGSCRAKCFLCCNSLDEPRPEDYDTNGVVYVFPILAEPIYQSSALTDRAAHPGCCGTAVPDYADRTRMYPRCYPSRQTMTNA